MRIHAAVPEDAPAFASIHDQCFEQKWSAQSFHGLLAEEFVFGLLAAPEDGDDFESFLLARAAGGESEILMLATVPAARCKGLASGLLNAAVAEAIRRGASRLFLEVEENNRPAAKLYAKHRFRPVGRRPAYFVSAGHSPMDALILRKDLPAP